MTRVLVVEAAGNLWGSERSLLDLLSATSRLDVAVCCPANTPLVAELKARGIRTLPFYVADLHRKSRGQRMRAALGVLRACLEFRPDVIHLNQSGSYKVVLPAARLMRLPVVAHVRIFEDAAYLAAQNPSPGRLAGIVAISEAVVKELRRFPSLASIPITRAYNAYVSRREVRDVREPMTIACVGRLIPIKGQDVLVDALGRLVSAGIDVRCEIAGDGDEAFVRRLRERSAGNGTQAAIEWLGFVDDIHRVLRKAALLICPSHREPLGRVILEAWDSGAVPIVFGGSGGAAEIVAMARGGILYHEQTPEVLADAIREGLELKPEDRQRLIDNGRAWMAGNCNPASYGESVSSILERVAIPGGHRQTRALIIEGAGNLWGSERSLLDLLTALPQLEPIVCCPPGTPLIPELTQRGVRTLPYFVSGLHVKSRLHRLRAAAGVLRACLACRPDVIHLNQSGSYKVALPAARLLGIPLIAHVRIFEDVDYLAHLRPDPKRLRGLIAISRAVEQAIRDSAPLSGIPLHRLYDSYVPTEVPAAPRRLSAQRIACVGRMVPIKGQDVLLRALGMLWREGRAFECLMVGDGPADFVESLKQIAAGEAIEGSVQWLGFLKEIGPVVRQCGVLVCPSHREPLGRVVLEAWDAGAVPVVFRGSGGAAEIVAAADGGIIYEEQTPEALGAALRAALDLPAQTATRLVENGRAWTAANCDPQTYGGAVADILSEAGSRSPSPA